MSEQSISDNIKKLICEEFKIDEAETPFQFKAQGKAFWNQYDCKDYTPKDLYHFAMKVRALKGKE